VGVGAEGDGAGVEGLGVAVGEAEEGAGYDALVLVGLGHLFFG